MDEPDVGAHGEPDRPTRPRLIRSARGLRAGSREVGPFERHLREAIDLNLRRASLYARLSEGASTALSRALVRRERLLLPLARWFDRRAEPFHRAGVPVLHDLFVPMERVPPWSSDAPPFVPTITLPPVRVVVAALRRAIDGGGFDSAAEHADDLLREMAPDAGCWCMRRHLLESLRRIARCAPLHLRATRAAGLPSPHPIHLRLYRLHLWGLADADRLDRRALPLQARGIPILCNDLPPIPPLPADIAPTAPSRDS